MIRHGGLESSPSGRPVAGCGSLPRPLTSFVGRERELAEARRLLAGTCLLTLTGPGGSGKTRLSIELAAGAARDYPDGVYFVRLAPVRDPGLVPSSIAQGIGLQDPRDRPLVEHPVSYLRDRKFLIVLDNFEHLLPAASVVAELLSGAGDLRIVVSSRAPLRVSGEQECPVLPLSVPDDQAHVTPASVAGCESVRLFAERAAAVAPGFAVDEQNAAPVAQIVRRLDGWPGDLDAALAEYGRQRDRCAIPLSDANLGIARLDLPAGALGAAWSQMNELEQALDDPAAASDWLPCPPHSLDSTRRASGRPLCG